MAVYAGKVTEIFTRPGKFGTGYTLNLSDGSRVGLGFLKFPPKVKEGQWVRIEASENEKGYLQGNVKDLVIEEAPKESVSSGSTVSQAVAGTKEGYWAGKEARDVKNDVARNTGAARNTAIEWIKFLVSVGALPMPKKTADIESGMQEVLDKYTEQFRHGAVEAPPAVVENDNKKEEKVEGEVDADWK